MITFTGRVQYRDGTEAEFETGTAAIAAYEDYAIRHGYPYGDAMPPTLSALVVAHYALQIPEGFDVWRPTVAGVELEANGVDPTNRDPTGGPG